MNRRTRSRKRSPHLLHQRSVHGEGLAMDSSGMTRGGMGDVNNPALAKALFYCGGLAPFCLFSASSRA